MANGEIVPAAIDAAATLPDWLTRRAEAAPHAVAAIGDGQAWTFADLDREASSTAGRLARLGIRSGERIALLMGNGLQFVALVHAATRLGAILVPLNTRLAAAELAWQIADVRATLLIYDRQQAPSARQIGAALPRLRRVAWERDGDELSLAALEPLGFVRRDLLDLASVQSIIYTSGTTGRPKGVMLTYGNHWWSAMGSALNLGNHAGDRWLLVLPLFHVGGLAIVMRSVIYGVPAIVHAHFDPEAANLAIDTQGVTLVSLVATMLERMLTARADRPYPPGLRAVLLGGGPAPLPLLERCARIGVPVVQTYGMTETASQAATLAPADALRKQGSAGRPLLPIELRIEHDGTALPPGATGEIVIRGPSVTPGYYDRPAATAETIRDGWLHTGDLGYLDAEGYLYVVDRRDDLIISGGENVYPAEVEAVLLAHPAVAEAGVFGVPDARWGRTVAAAVVLRPGIAAEPESMVDYCAERLARYKVPRRIHVVTELPRNAAGKLLRRALRDTWPGAE